MFLFVPNPEPTQDFIESAGFRSRFALLVQENAKLADRRSPVRCEIGSGQSHAASSRIIGSSRGVRNYLKE
jgi:hypothetical protein